jgi:hypothetical protein
MSAVAFVHPHREEKLMPKSKKSKGDGKKKGAGKKKDKSVATRDASGKPMEKRHTKRHT